MMEHGGNIYQASQETTIPLEKILDFSASINPLGVPESVITEIKRCLHLLINYPEPSADQLVSRLAERLGLSPSSIICGNGSTELIYLISRALSPKKVLIPAPTFSEYERACTILKQGVNILRYRLSADQQFDLDPYTFSQAMAGCDLAFLCQPNNPTGRLLEKAKILMLAEAARQHSCYLVVDEAFIDFSPLESVIHKVAQNPYLIVLRSMTKFYALAGLRLGYGVFHESLIKAVNRYKEPWTVNFLAQRAGLVALDDVAYQERAFQVMQAEKRFMETAYQNLGITYFSSAANYYLLRMPKAKEVLAGLKQKGILVRDGSNFSGLDHTYLRVAVKSRQDNLILIKELSLCLES